MSAVYSTEKYQAAADRLREDPTSLTDEDIEQLAICSDVVAEHARRKRAGLTGLDELERDDDVRKSLMETPATLLDVYSSIYKFHWLAHPIEASHVWRMRQNHSRIEALELEVATLKSQLAEVLSRPKGLLYQGVWTMSEKYVQGDVVTWTGSMWVAKVDNIASVPSEGHGTIWQLAVKRGKDR